MFMSFAGFVAFLLLVFLAAPDGAAAQRSARIGVGARVVASVAPEVLETADQELTRVMAADTLTGNWTPAPASAASGIARVVSERLRPAADSLKPRQTPATESETQPRRTEFIRITVAFTAN